MQKKEYINFNAGLRLKDVGCGINSINIVERLFNELNISKSSKPELKKIALENILANVIYSTQFMIELKFFRGKMFYSPIYRKQYPHYSYDLIVKLANKLKERGYTSERLGHYDPIKEEGEVTRLFGTNKLFDLFSVDNDFPIIAINYSRINQQKKEQVIVQRIKKLKPIELIILKNEHKIPIKFRETTRTRSMKRFLDKYNNFMRHHKVIHRNITLREYTVLNSINESMPPEDYGVQISSMKEFRVPLNFRTPGKPDYSFWSDLAEQNKDTVITKHYKIVTDIELDCRLYRVFSRNSFKKGGRFYGAGYQLLSETDRGKLTIDNEPVVELDYGSMSLNMLYNGKGIYKQGDLYSGIVDDRYRFLVKRMINTVLNATSWYNAKISFDKYIDKFEVDEEENGNDKKTLIIEFKKEYSTANFINKILKHYHEIKDNFFSVVGLELQRDDSDIAELILKHFLKKDIVCLCIHDSFIVQERYQKDLYETMRFAYKKFYDFDIIIK